MELLPISFIAGILTVLAPCILPLLPVIIGGSLKDQSKKRPLIITASLAVSVVVFSLLLKASTAFINIPDSFWTWFSGGIILIFAITLLFPNAYAKITNKYFKTGLEHKSQKLIYKFLNKKGFWSEVVLGAALGPVFAACSPTYFIILGTVLPASFGIGLLNLIAFAVGLGFVMLLIAYSGQKVMSKLNIASDPNGWFKKTLGVLFLIVAIGIITGQDKKFEVWLLDQGLFDVTKVEQRLLDKQPGMQDGLFSAENSVPETAMVDPIVEPDTASDNAELEMNLNKVQENEQPVVEEAISQAEEMPVAVQSTSNVPQFNFPIRVPAPELAGLTNWLNSSGYNSLEELKGKVVLIDFWTYSCINCIRTLPSLQALHETYADDGLVILGLHAPEFAFEKKPENVADAVAEYGLTYPVAQDNDFTTWRNYENRYWPAKYLIDKDGFVRWTHFGEGAYQETERAIATLLNIPAESDTFADTITAVDFRKIGTHETYIGTKRRDNYLEDGAEPTKNGEWSLSGDFDEDGEKITTTDEVTLKMKFLASSANLVFGGAGDIEVYIDGEKYKDITVRNQTLYNLFNDPGNYAEHDLELIIDEDIEVYAFTFG